MVNVNVVGRLGADAELIKGENGTFLSFRMAVDDGKNKNGDRLTSLVIDSPVGLELRLMETEPANLLSI